MLKQYLILFFLSAFWCFITLVDARTSRVMSYYDGILSFGVFLTVLSAQGMLLFVFNRLRAHIRNRLKKKKKNTPATRKRLQAAEWVLAKLPFPCLAMANLLCFYLAFISDISVLSVWQLVPILAGGGMAAFAFFEFTTALGKKAYVFVALTGALALSQGLIFWQDIKVYPYEASAEGETASAEVRAVDFKHTPNIYLISWDALAPAALVKEYLNVDHVNYVKWMKDSGFRLFKNAFSDGYKTFATFNRIAAMHPEYYRHLAEKNRHRDIFAGRSPAPLWEIFKSNSYKTHIYQLYSLGCEASQLIDDCYVAYPFTMCSHSTGLQASIGFFGYCAMQHNKSFMRLWGLGDKTGGGNSYMGEYIHSIDRRLGEALSDGGRHVVASYIPLPGHANFPDGYDDPEHRKLYRGHFLAMDSTVMPNVMNQVLSYILKHDPNPIVLYFGDHGMYMSDIYAGKKDLYDAHRKFVVQDRFGITMGIYPKDVCRSYFDAPPLQKYANISMVLHQLFSCLSEGEHPMPGFEGYGFYNEFYKEKHIGYVWEEPGKFEDYLYE